LELRLTEIVLEFSYAIPLFSTTRLVLVAPRGSAWWYVRNLPSPWKQEVEVFICPCSDYIYIYSRLKDLSNNLSDLFSLVILMTLRLALLPALQFMR